jgi:hypothetical protein
VFGKFPRCLTLSELCVATRALHELCVATRALHELIAGQMSHKRYVELARELADLLSGEDPGRVSRVLMEELDDWPKLLVDSLRSVCPDMTDRGFGSSLDDRPVSVEDWLQWHWLEPVIWREVALQMALEVRGTRHPGTY